MCWAGRPNTFSPELSSVSWAATGGQVINGMVGRMKAMGTKRGFTLIELLVVIAIIAVLAAILFPVFRSAVQSSQTSSCLNNMMQLGRGFRMYMDNWGGRFPGSAAMWSFDNNKAAGEWVYYIFPRMDVTKGSIWPYVKNTKVYICPSDISERKRHFGLSYSMNQYLDGNWYGVTESLVVRPTATVLLIDEGAGKPSPIVDGSFGPSVDAPTNIHGDGCNFAYCDGHAKWIKQHMYKRLLWRYDAQFGVTPPPLANK